MSGEIMGNFPNTIIRASAGTGKTFALSNRYLQLLASGVEPETILATTFTRKGAGEILDRIIQRLSDAALNDEAAKTLSKEIQWKLPRDRAANILHQLLGNLHRLEISTLDSFFIRVARAFSLELGLPPSWSIVEQQQIDDLSDDAIQAVLRDENVHNLLHMMSKGEAQRRVASMIRDTVQSIYGIFLEAGDQEIWDQLPQLGSHLSESELDVIGLQIKNLPEEKRKNLNREWGKIASYFANGEWEAIVKTNSFQGVISGADTYGKTRSKLKPEQVAVLQALLPHCLAVFTQRLRAQNQSTHALLSQFGAILETTKDETGQLRFDDVSNRLIEFVSMWDTDQFSFRLDHQIQHLLLDEFQDTSPPQWKVIRPFALQVTQTDSLRSFFCVGDMKQAIFGWRGGVAEIFELVDKELRNLESDSLIRSYRSAQPVIDLVNTVFSNLGSYNTKDTNVDQAIQNWSNWFVSHETVRPEFEGFVSFEYGDNYKESGKEPRDRQHAIRNDNMYDAAVARIKLLAETIPEHQTIGVLVRTNDEVGELIFRLQEAGVHASEEGGNALTDSAAVELILSAICLADHPNDDLARYHVSHSPLAEDFGLKPEDDLTQPDNKLTVAVGAAEMRARLVRDGYGPTVEALARKLIPLCTRRETIRLQHLVCVAYASPSDNDRWALRPKRFVDYVRDEVKIADQSGAQIRVMTIHQSKGLEFDSVVLPMKYVTNGWFGHQPSVVVGRDSPTEPIRMACRYVGEEFRNLLPANFQKMFAEDRQRTVREAMCVLYVALTRAVHSTHIVASYSAKATDKSAAGVLLSALGIENRSAGIVYQHGNADWYKSAPESEELPADIFNLKQFYLSDDTNLNRGTVSGEVRSGRGVRAVGPSQLEGGEMIKLGEMFKTRDNHAALLRGTMIHGCLELVKWLDQGIPSRPEIIEHLKKLDPTLENYERYAVEFESMIEHESIAKLLSYQTYLQDFAPDFAVGGEVMLEAHRLEVETERPFAVNLDGEMLNGLIDRLILVFEGDTLVGADVIDFKTDPVNTEGLGRRLEYYRPQLNAYRQAVSKFTKLPVDSISARLAFVETGQIVIVDQGQPSPSENLKSAKLKKRRGQAKQSVVPKPKTVSTRNQESKQQQTLWDD